MVSFSSMALCDHKPANLEGNTEWCYTVTLSYSVGCLEQTLVSLVTIGLLSLKDLAFLVSMSLYSFSHCSLFPDLYTCTYMTYKPSCIAFQVTGAIHEFCIWNIGENHSCTFEVQFHCTKSNRYIVCIPCRLLPALFLYINNSYRVY